MELFLQLLVSGLALGSLYALLSMGYGLIYGTTGEFHVAHAGIFTFTGYFGYIAHEKWQLGLPASIVIATVFAALMGVVLQSLFYEPMRRKNASHLTIFIAALGLMIVLENVASIIFGYAPLQFTDNGLKSPIRLKLFSFTPLQLVIVLTAAAVTVVVLLYLKKSRMGKAIRGVADSPEMAKIIGMSPQKVHIAVYALGSAISAPAAVLLAFDSGAVPYRGTMLILLAAIAMILGGIGSPGGAALAGLILGLSQNLALLFVPAEWANIFTFTLFLIIIFLIPTGFFGVKMAKKI